MNSPLCKRDVEESVKKTRGEHEREKPFEKSFPHSPFKNYYLLKFEAVVEQRCF